MCYYIGKLILSYMLKYVSRFLALALCCAPVLLHLSNFLHSNFILKHTFREGNAYADILAKMKTL